MEKFAPNAAFFLLVAVVALIYWPGLNGPFLFDDFANLNALGTYGGVRDLETLKLYLVDAHAGPSGRPISVLSFLLNDVNWPSEPWSFKYTNFLIHLLNGILLCWLIYRLLLINSEDKYTAAWIAILTAGVWLLHPLNVSTTLYVVQRMALLSGLFVILGLLVYVYGRSVFPDKPRKGYAVMTLAVVTCTPLAVFSKENGCLLPLLALVVEYTVLRQPGINLAQPSRTWNLIFLWGPVALLMFYIGEGLISGRIQSGFSERPFTLYERLLTESRILFDYLYHWFIPHLQNRGLFAEDYPVSKDLFSPVSTVFAVTGIIAGGILSVVLRKRCPLISLAVLFFLGGHLIESSVFPLELYFEHRNYLPAVFLFLPVSYFIVVQSRQYPILKIAGVLLLCIPAMMTASAANVWSSSTSLALSWAKENPKSPRAQRVAAMALDKEGHSDLALLVLNKARMEIPDNIPVQLHFLLQKCFTEGVNSSDIAVAIKNLETIFYDFRTFEFLKAIITTAPSEACKGISNPDVFAILNALEKNPGANKKGGALRQLHHLRGRLYVSEKNSALALQEFEKAFDFRPDPDAGLLEVAILASNGMHREALQHLDRVRDVVNRKTPSKPNWKMDYAAEVKRLQETIEHDMVSEHTS